MVQPGGLAIAPTLPSGRECGCRRHLVVAERATQIRMQRKLLGSISNLPATGSDNYLAAITTTRKSGIMAEQALKSILGSQLRALRSTRGLTQEAIADELGFTPRYYAGIERGERNLSLDSIDDLAVKLAVPATSLLTIN